MDHFPESNNRYSILWDLAFGRGSIFLYYKYTDCVRDNSAFGKCLSREIREHQETVSALEKKAQSTGRKLIANLAVLL